MAQPTVCQGATCDDQPQVCVDWCDAEAYCSSVGKQLCRGIGGVEYGFFDRIDASKSQWSHACTSGGKNAYPYGASYDGQDCNGQDYGAGTTVPVASLDGCQSSEPGYAGAFDLSGNVREWEGLCMEECSVRGGSFLLGDEAALGCNDLWSSASFAGRNEVFDDCGFRCCSF